jgi:hypothetical protein
MTVIISFENHSFKIQIYSFLKMNTNQKKSKGGVEKLRLKRNAELKTYANDPKQKMCIGHFSNAVRAIFLCLRPLSKICPLG